LDRLDRCRKLFKGDFSKISSAKVLLLGVGGVGSFALDCLYRTGFGEITVVDRDRFEVSNQNRQLGSEFVGELKIDVLKRMYPGIKGIEADVNRNWIEGFDFECFDVVIDAIDDVFAKVVLANKLHHKLISASGSARKRDFFSIKKSNISEAKGDRLLAKFKRELKRSGFEGDFKVVYSSEEVHIRDKEFGSFVGVTGAFGLALCSLAVEKVMLS